MIPISAFPGSDKSPIGIDCLHSAILDLLTKIPKIQYLKQQKEKSQIVFNEPFRFAIDHCFSLRGQGTILTGTVLSGEIKVNDMIELPELKVQKKVKSMQMFRKPVQSAIEGDRIGICVTQLSSKLIERGVAGSPGAYLETNGAIISAQKIQFFKNSIKNKSRMHISIGHATVMATIQIFAIPKDERNDLSFHFNRDFIFMDSLEADSDDFPSGSQFILLTFEKKIICPANCMVIGSKLDSDINANVCRLAFSGNLIECIDSSSTQDLQKLRIFTPKERRGVIDRLVDERTLIGNKLFSKQTNMSIFIGLNISRSSNNAVGRIESAFGKSGKFKVYFPDGGQTDTDGELVLSFKKYIFDKQKKIVQ